MNRFTHLLICILVLSLSACLPAVSPPTATAIPPTTAPPTSTSVPPTETPAAPTFTAIPTLTEAPTPTATPPFDLNDGNKAVVLDFTARLCEAIWMNGVETGLPCPGDLNDVSRGYVGLLSGSDQSLPADFALVMMYPSPAIFGRYPKFRVGPFDAFKVTLACRSDIPCDFEFQLAYYDANGQYKDPYPPVAYKQGDPPLNYVNQLNGLGGKTVELVLAIRSYGDPAAGWALLIAPRVLRP
jgi:hypothetical protein